MFFNSHLQQSCGQILEVEWGWGRDMETKLSSFFTVIAEELVPTVYSVSEELLPSSGLLPGASLVRCFW